MRLFKSVNLTSTGICIRHFYPIRKTVRYLTQATRKAAAEQGRRMISADLSITSSKKGFEYFNELFIKRHRKVLWSASVKIAVVSLACVGGLLIACLVNPAFASKANQMLISLVHGLPVYHVRHQPRHHLYQSAVHEL